MLKREAIRGVNILLRHNSITPSRMSFVLNSCNDVSVIQNDGLHNDTLYYRSVTLYFNLKGKEITKSQFEHSQAIADAAEARLHPTRQEGGLTMLTKLIVNCALGAFTAGQVLEDRNQIGEYLRTSLNEGRFAPEIGADEIANILDHADKSGKNIITTEDDEIELTLYLGQYYPDTVPAKEPA